MRVEKIYIKTENIISLAATITEVLSVKAHKDLKNHSIKDVTCSHYQPL
jgi:hypothetical protein